MRENIAIVKGEGEREIGKMVNNNRYLCVLVYKMQIKPKPLTFFGNIYMCVCVREEKHTITV